MSFESILKEKNIGIKDISEGAGIPESTMFHAIKGNFRSMKFETIVKLCQYLDCLPHELTLIGTQRGSQIEQNEKIIEYSFAELPSFTSEQIKYIADMLNGSLYNPSIPPQKYLQIQVLDADEYDNLGGKWGVDSMELAKKIAKLTSHQAYAIIRKIQNWWDKPNAERDLDNIF